MGPLPAMDCVAAQAGAQGLRHHASYQAQTPGLLPGAQTAVGSEAARPHQPPWRRERTPRSLGSREAAPGAFRAHQHQNLKCQGPGCVLHVHQLPGPQAHHPGAHFSPWPQYRRSYDLGSLQRAVLTPAGGGTCDHLPPISTALSTTYIFVYLIYKWRLLLSHFTDKKPRLRKGERLAQGHTMVGLEFETSTPSL